MLNETAQLFDFPAERVAISAPYEHGPDSALIAGLIGAPQSVGVAIMRRFGSLTHVMGASLAEIGAVQGVTPRMAQGLHMAQLLAKRTAVETVVGRCVLSSWSAVRDYLKTALAGKTREEFHVLFLDKKNQLIAAECMGAGSIAHCPVYPREVMRRALELGAAGLILAHNHPSGDASPSTADIQMTKQLIDAAKVFDIAIHDHMIIGAGDPCSLKARGLM